MQRFGLIAVFVLGALGCSGGEKPRVPVAGRVLYKGFPVKEGRIAFIPDKERGHSGEIAKANLNSDGTFRIGEGGLAPGWYRITIAAMYTKLPEKYRDPDLCNLSKEVVAGKENQFDIILDD